MSKNACLTHFYEEFTGALPLMRLLYGKPREVRIEENGGMSTTESHVFFTGDKFVVEQFERSRERITAWALYVLKAGGVGDALSKVKNVYPGAHVLLETSGKRNVEKIQEWLTELSEHTRPETIDDEVYLLADFRLRAKAKLDSMKNLIRVK